MEQNNKAISSENALQFIINSLKNERNLEYLGQINDKEEFDYLIKVRDEQNKEYSIQIITLSQAENYDDQDFSFLKMLKKAKERVQMISQCNHPNILKYHSDFQLRNYYCIQMEMFSLTLQQWISKQNSRPIDQDLYVKISIELLEAVKYIHSMKLNLPNLTLNKILIGQNESIKLYNIGYSEEVHKQTLKLKQQEALENNDIFYYQLYLFEKYQNKIKLNNVSDMYVIGISLFALAGASNQQIMDFISGNGRYPAQLHLGYDINTILLNFLNKKKGSNRLVCASNVLQSLQNVTNTSLNQKTSTHNTNKELNDKEQDQSNSNQKFTEQKESNQSKLQIYIDTLEEGYLKGYEQQQKEALDNIKTCIKLNPRKNNILYFQQAKYYKLTNQTDLAVKSYKKAIKINQSDDSSIYNLGNIYWEQLDLESAQKQYQLAIKINPQDDWAYNNLGIIYKLLVKFDESIECYKRVLEITEDDHGTCFNLGIIYNERQEYQKSVCYYKKAININPKKHTAHNNLGNIYYKKKMMEEAVKSLKRALQETPNEQLYKTNLFLYKRFI